MGLNTWIKTIDGFRIVIYLPIIKVISQSEDLKPVAISWLAIQSTTGNLTMLWPYFRIHLEVEFPVCAKQPITKTRQVRTLKLEDEVPGNLKPSCIRPEHAGLCRVTKISYPVAQTTKMCYLVTSITQEDKCWRHKIRWWYLGLPIIITRMTTPIPIKMAIICEMWFFILYVAKE